MGDVIFFFFFLPPLGALRREVNHVRGCACVEHTVRHLKSSEPVVFFEKSHWDDGARVDRLAPEVLAR